jgi:hypothetical protein
MVRYRQTVYIPTENRRNTNSEDLGPHVEMLLLYRNPASNVGEQDYYSKIPTENLCNVNSEEVVSDVE